jgi:hypothetical protein
MKVDTLQSGFVTLPSKEILATQTKKTVITLTANLMSKIMQDKGDENLMYHGPITDYYRINRDSIRTLKEFDEKEKVIKYAISVFGKSMRYWYNTQKFSYCFSEHHQNYVDDTFGFILGNKRIAANESWYRLLDATRVDESAFDEYKWFNGNNTARSFMPDNIIDLLCLWISRENGIYDLLETMYVIYGKRT